MVRLPVNRIRLFLGEGLYSLSASSPFLIVGFLSDTGKNTVVLADDKTLGDYAEIKAGGNVSLLFLLFSPLLFYSLLISSSLSRLLHFVCIATVNWKDLGPQIGWTTVNKKA